jgi:hypothetical protein
MRRAVLRMDLGQSEALARRGAGRLDAEHTRLAVLRIPAKVYRGLLGGCRFYHEWAARREVTHR